MKKLRKLQSFNDFKRTEMVQEKWYHNVLAGLMMLTPGITQAVQLNADTPQIVQTLGQEEAFEDIQAIIDYVKVNKKDFKNSEKIVKDLSTLLRRVKSGKVSEEQALTIAKDFIEEAKGMERPALLTSQKQKSGYKVVSTFKDVVKETKANVISVEIDSDIQVDFNSGAYKEIDSKVVKKVKDTINGLEELNYKLSGVTIESSTDGQRLSSRLKRDLISQDYTGDNAGLSKIRNDKMKDAVKDIIDTTSIEQDYRHLDDGIIDDSKRYNKVVLEFTAIEKSTEVVQEEVKVYYKVVGLDQDKIDDIGKKDKYKPKKNNKKSIDSSTECFYFVK